MRQFPGYGDARDGSVASANGTVNSYAACTTTSGSAVVTTALSVNVGDFVLLHQSRDTGVGEMDIVEVATVGSGQFTAKNTIPFSYGAKAQAVKVPQYAGGTLGNTLTVAAWDGTIGGIAVICVDGTVNLSGSLNAAGANGGTNSAGSAGGTANGVSGGGYRSGYGRVHNINPTQGQAGEGTAGDPAVQSTANGNGGGSGSNNGGGQGGGGGGNGTAGANGSTIGANTPIGGQVSGAANLVQMTFGGGGGGGTRYTTTTGDVGAGGSGGGIIIVIARKITTTGSINANGGNGGNASGSGGGGGGGSILLIGETINLGTNLVTASGGSGGTNGGAGGNGRIFVNYYSAVTGTTTPAYNSIQNKSLAPTSGNFFYLLV